MSVTDYSGSEIPMIDAWVESRLALFAVDLEAIAAGLSAAVYPDFAPEGTPYPFIVYQCQSPPRDIRGVGVSRVMVDTLYVVKAVSQAVSYDPLRPIAGIIDRAMTAAEGGSVGSGLVLSSVRERQFSMVEVDAGTQYRHLGGEFKIHAQG